MQKNLLNDPAADGLYLTMYGYVPDPSKDKIPAHSRWLTNPTSEEGALDAAMAIAEYAFGVPHPLPSLNPLAWVMYDMYHNVMFPKQNASAGIAHMLMTAPRFASGPTAGGGRVHETRGEEEACEEKGESRKEVSRKKGGTEEPEAYKGEGAGQKDNGEEAGKKEKEVGKQNSLPEVFRKGVFSLLRLLDV